MLKLTIAIPTFNGGKNLERAINSCKNIQLPSDEYEILVVDNCSTDESISNVKELRKKIGNLILIENQENVGRIQNWNVCIEKSTGKFLIFLFSNDMINEQNNIHECLKILDADEAISIGFSSLLRKGNDSSYLKKSFSSEIIFTVSECSLNSSSIFI